MKAVRRMESDDVGSDMQADFIAYANRLNTVLSGADWAPVVELAQKISDCWRTGKRVLICGNGGSAGNAAHLANDFLYGVAKRTGGGINVLALSANPSVITCLANDVGYEHIFSEQLAVHGEPGDLLIVLSGSGNSPNVVRALEQARSMGIESCAILGYSGGRCKDLADIPIHFAIDDMQIAEDLQMVVGHMVMQWLSRRAPQVELTV